jgi:hypothetical protein
MPRVRLNPQWQHYEGPRREYGELWTPFDIGRDGHFEVEFSRPPDAGEYVRAPASVRLCFSYPE